MDAAITFVKENPILGYAGAGLALFLYVATLVNVRLWCQFEALLGVSYVIALPFTSQLLRVWLDGNEGNYAAKCMFALVLLGMICLAYQIHGALYVQDPVVTSSLHITCILSRIGLIFAAVNAMFFSTAFSRDALMGDCIFLSLLAFGNLFHLTKVSTRDGLLTLSRPIRKRVLGDAIVCFIIGLVLVGFPDTVFASCAVEHTTIHIMLAKSFGFQVIAFSVQSFASLCYKHDDDIMKLYLPKLWILVPVTGWILWDIAVTEFAFFDAFLLCTLSVLLLQNFLICCNSSASSKQD